MKRLFAALVLIVSLGEAFSWANYNVTQGAGTPFGSIVVSTIHYAQQLICDPTTPSQCAAVSAGGAVKVDGSAVTQPVSSATLATAANQSSQITQETATATGIGTAGTTPCASPTTACALLQLIQGMWTDVRGAIPAGSAFIGQVGLNATTSGGWTPNHLVAANSNNSTNLKASAGIVHAVQGFSVDAAPIYIKLYDKATAPTCGSDTPVKVIMIPAASTAANGAGAVSNIIDVQFSTGIGFCVVTGITNASNVSVAANTSLIEIDWK